MIICITDVIAPDKLADFVQRAAALPFQDGKITAGWHASLVKSNRQARPGDKASADVIGEARDFIASSEVFTRAGLPKTLGPVVISRYGVGDAYGPHVDDAVMSGGSIRSDLSFTLFLSEPEAYEGGALVIHGSSGDDAYRLPAGAMILYPSNTLHSVEPVTAGERLVVVGWAQSLVRDPAKRELLFDLDNVRRRQFQAEGKTPDFDILTKSYTNLLRLWADA